MLINIRKQTNKQKVVSNMALDKGVNIVYN